MPPDPLALFCLLSSPAPSVGGGLCPEDWLMAAQVPSGNRSQADRPLGVPKCELFLSYEALLLHQQRSVFVCTEDSSLGSCGHLLQLTGLRMGAPHPASAVDPPRGQHHGEWTPGLAGDEQEGWGGAPSWGTWGRTPVVPSFPSVLRGQRGTSALLPWGYGEPFPGGDPVDKAEPRRWGEARGLEAPPGAGAGLHKGSPLMQP